VLDHLDETGQPCTRHPPASHQIMLALAMLGSRMPSFHHDVASKLQSLMLALEELDEISPAAEVRAVAATANAAVRDLQALFAANRSLSRPPQAKPTPLGELIAAAAQRAGVRTHGALPAAHVEVSLPAMTHALAIVFDLAAGPTTLGRTLELSAALDGAHVLVTITADAEAFCVAAANASEVLALASFALARERGELRCGPASFALRLPLQQ
jgi:hypothetical protein